MVKEWWNKHTGISQVCGLEIILDSGGGLHAYICSLRLENNVVSVIHQSAQSGLKSTLEKLKLNKVPLAVNFSGDGVISRVVPIHRSGSVVDSAFPGIEKEKFYIQEFPQKNHVVVSLVNRNATDSVLDQFKGYSIINISLGGLVPAIIRKQTDQQAAEFSFGPHFLVFDETMDAVSYEFKKEGQEDTAIRFQGIKVNGRYLNAFAQAFQIFFYPQLLPIGVESQKQDPTLFYKYGQIKFASMLLLALTFIVLLVNFLLWNSWSEEKKDMDNQMVFNRGMVESRDSLLSRISRQEQRLKNLGILPLSHQQLIYEIGNIPPSGIKLTSIEINPDNKDKETYDQLVIKGELQNVNAYEQFKRNLGQSKLKLKIVGEELSYNENKNASFFEMRVSLY